MVDRYHRMEDAGPSQEHYTVVVELGVRNGLLGLGGRRVKPAFFACFGSRLTRAGSRGRARHPGCMRRIRKLFRATFCQIGPNLDQTLADIGRNLSLQRPCRGEIPVGPCSGLWPAPRRPPHRPLVENIRSRPHSATQALLARVGAHPELTPRRHPSTTCSCRCPERAKCPGSARRPSQA